MTKTTHKLSRRSMLLLAGVLFIAQAASAQIWTAAASTCMPDETSFGLYQANMGGVVLNLAPPLVSTVVLRCNVTSPAGTVAPAWTRLTLGYWDPDGPLAGAVVQAQLWEVTKATSVTTPVAGALVVSALPGYGVGSAVFVHPFDFNLYVYYVEITISRINAGGQPGALFVALD